MSGFLAAPGLGPHTVTKFGVVGLSETLAVELAGSTVGVSGDPGEDAPATAQLAALMRGGIDPKEVARRVMIGIRDNDLYVFTHPEMRAPLEERFHQHLGRLR